MLERGSRRQKLREAMTCFVFPSRTVRPGGEIKKGNDSREEEEEEEEEKEEEEDDEGEESEEEAEERRERRDRGQSSSHGVRSTERLIFFHPFSFLPPVPPVGPSVSLSPSVSVEKVAACVLFIFLPAPRPFSAPIVHPTSRPPRNPSRLFFAGPGAPSPPRLTCVYPAILLSNLFRSPFRCHSSWRGGGAALARQLAQMGGREALRARRNYGERKVVRLMKSQFSVLPFADSAAGPSGL